MYRIIKRVLLSFFFPMTLLALFTGARFAFLSFLSTTTIATIVPTLFVALLPFLSTTIATIFGIIVVVIVR